jgi:hypothetical protein
MASGQNRRALGVFIPGVSAEVRQWGMDDNWIERRFHREDSLRHTEDLWQSISTAIDNTCKSFNAHYAEIGTANFQPQNGHSILIEINHQANRNIRMDTKRRVRITFSGQAINVTIDEHPAKTFPIDSDGERCFIKSPKLPKGEELTPDQFSEVALTDAFFTPRNPEVAKSPRPRYGPWN